MKMLFLCSTEFQLLTALNIRYHMYPNDDADIIVNNYHGEEKELADRIRKTKLFSNVFYVRTYIEEKTLHRYFRCFIDGEPRIQFSWAIMNSFRFLKTKWMTAVLGEKSYIDNMIDDSSKLQLNKYNAFFAYGSKKIARYLLDYLLKNNSLCQINLIDEGTGTYYEPELGKYSMEEVLSGIVDRFYVYDPDVVVYKKDLCRIPKLRKDDKIFIDLVNYVFQFTSEDLEDYHNGLVFFDQNVFNKTPKYLQGKSWIVRMIFHNAYLRHLKEEKDFYRQLEIINLVLSKQTADNVWIKLHPRTTKDIFKELEQRNLKIIRRYDLPWELIALNCPVGNNILVTNYSSAVCLYNAVLENQEDSTRCVLLYKFSKLKFLEDGDKFFDMLRTKYNNIFIPETDEDLVFA